MSPPKLEQIDESVFELLAKIRKRPPMYLGEASLNRLHAFLVGYQSGLGRVGKCLRLEQEFSGFHEWVAQELDFAESTTGWCNMILSVCRNDEEALNRFFELLDLYCKERRLS